MQLRLQELGSVLVTLHVGVDSLGCVLENLLFEAVSEIKDDIISVGLDGEGEEVNFKLDSGIGEVLESQSELATHDEHLDGLGSHQVVLVGVQELHNVAVREHHLAEAELVFPLVVHQNGDEVDELDDGLLVLVNLGALDLDEFVTDVFADVEGDLVLQHVLDHLVVASLEQIQDVVSRDVEVGVVGDGHLEFVVLGHLGDLPGIVDELSALLELGVHD
mmetsp:Transcript_12339/g.19164  ORF Transcript_12339/g.19164 Transcript_12339/m.19164 type:complete len:219 (+) Transcript_12339:2954-3610(+)